jgi:hypothetical protein
VKSRYEESVFGRKGSGGLELFHVPGQPGLWLIPHMGLGNFSVLMETTHVETDEGDGNPDRCADPRLR